MTTEHSGSPRAFGPWLGAITGLALAVLILGPALKSGFLLSYDMIFVPELSLSPRTLGVDGSVPRAVPNDAVVAALSLILPGDIVQKVLLIAIFVLVGTGLGLVLKKVPAVVVATVVAIWNPWVAQRLEVGHWGFLLGYAALPWVVWAAQNARKKTPFAMTSLGLVMLLGSLSGSTGFVLMLIVLAGVLICERPRHWWPFVWGTGISFLVSATWWWPFLNAAPRAADPAGVAAFAARADTPWGVIVSVMTGGGSWNQASWYAERQSWILTAVAFLFVVLAIVTLFRSARIDDGFRGLAIASVLSLVLATMSALPGGREIFTLVVSNVPGAGLLRDSQKLAGPWMIAVAIGAGLLAQKFFSFQPVRERGVHWFGVVAGVLIPIILLPSLAWGSRGSWEAVEYPEEMLALAEQLDEAQPGSVAVFPWIQYRRFDWNNNRIVLDPWNRLTRKDVLVNDGLPLSDGRIAGEDERAAEVSRLVLSEEFVVPGLRSLGVRHVVILDDQPNQDLDADRLLGAELRSISDGLQWWDLGEVNAPEPSVTWRDLLGWILAAGAGMLVLCALVLNVRKQKM